MIAGAREMRAGSWPAKCQGTRRLGMRPVGFLDDDPVKVGKLIYGIPVVGRLRDLPRHPAGHAVRPDHHRDAKGHGQRRARGGRDSRRAGVVSRTIPGVFELLGGSVSVSRLRQVDIADLLRRPPVEAGRAAGYIQGRTVLVTGGGGSIGFDLPGKSRTPCVPGARGPPGETASSTPMGTCATRFRASPSTRSSRTSRPVAFSARIRETPPRCRVPCRRARAPCC